MNISKTFLRSRWLLGILLMASLGAASADAADTKLEVRLVWGTNAETSPKENHKALEAPLAKKLGMFKWKNYFTVNKQEMLLSGEGAKKVRLSKHSEIEIKHLDGQRYEINVFGEGKHVRKITEKITRKDSLVIAGDDKNDCAWFILIREIQ